MLDAFEKVLSLLWLRLRLLLCLLENIVCNLERHGTQKFVFDFEAAARFKIVFKVSYLLLSNLVIMVNDSWALSVPPPPAAPMLGVVHELLFDREGLGEQIFIIGIF